MYFTSLQKEWKEGKRRNKKIIFEEGRTIRIGTSYRSMVKNLFFLAVATDALFDLGNDSNTEVLFWSSLYPILVWLLVVEQFSFEKLNKNEHFFMYRRGLRKLNCVRYDEIMDYSMLRLGLMYKSKDKTRKNVIMLSDIQISPLIQMLKSNVKKHVE